MDGYRVMPMADAAKIADIFVTTTGDLNVVDERHIADAEGRRDRRQLRPLQRRDQHRRAEPPRRLAGARSASSSRSSALDDGRRVYLLADGRLVNLSAAEGHPAAVMDMSFANQALSAEYVTKNRASCSPRCTWSRRTSTARSPG